MFIIYRKNLSTFNNIKNDILIKINIIVRKLNIILLAKIKKPCSIFDDITDHITNKKIINKISTLNYIYKQLKIIYNNVKQNNYDTTQIRVLKMKLVRKS